MKVLELFEIVDAQNIFVESGYHGREVLFPEPSAGNLQTEIVTGVRVIENNIYVHIKPSDGVFEEWVRIINEEYGTHIDNIMKLWEEYKYATQDPS